MKRSICLASLLIGGGLGLFAQPKIYQTPAGSTVSEFNTATMTETGAINVGASNLATGLNGAEIYAVNSFMGVVAASTVARLPLRSQTSLSGPNVLARSPDGGILYVGGESQTTSTLTLLNAASLGVLRSIETASTAGYLPIILAVLPDGSEVFQLSEHYLGPPTGETTLPFENVVEEIDVRQGKVVSVLPAGIGTAMALSPDGTKLFYASSAHSASVEIQELDVATGQIVGTVPVSATQLSFSPDGSELYALEEGRLNVISAASAEVTGQIPVPAGSRLLVVNPAEPTAYIASIDKNSRSSLVVVDLVQEAVTATVPLAAQSTSLAISNNGKQLYVSLNPTNAISVADAATEKTVGTVECTGYAQFAAVSADGTRLYALCSPIDLSAPTSLISANARTLERLQSVTITGVEPAAYLAVSPDGKTVYVPVASPTQGINEIQAFDSATLQPKATYNVNPDAASYVSAQGIAISADGNYLYALAVNRTNASVLAKVSIASGTVVGQALLGNEAWSQVAISPAGDVVYVGGYNPNSQTGEVQPIQTGGMKLLKPYPYCGEHLALTSDGSTLYAGGCLSGNVDDIYAINTATGSATATIPLQPTPSTGYFSFALSPDNTQLYVATGPGGPGTLDIDLASGTQSFFQGPSGLQLAIGPK